MTIKTGCYYITNVAYKNRVFIPDHDDGTPLQASCGEDVPGEQWTVTLHPNGRYSIQNLGKHTCFANGRASTADNSVIGRSIRQLWIIEETSAKGNYRIGLSGLTSVWALLDGEDGVPVTLDSVIANPRTWWTFTVVGEVIDSPPATIQIILFELALPPSTPALPLEMDFLIIQEMPGDSSPNVSKAIDEVCRPLTAELQNQAPRANLVQFKSFGSNKIRFQRYSSFVTFEELLNAQGSDLLWRMCRGDVVSWLKKVVSDLRAEAMKVVVLNLDDISFWNGGGTFVDVIGRLVEQGIHMILTLTQPTLGEILHSTGLFGELDDLSLNVLHLKKGDFSDYIADYITTASRLMEEKRAAERRRIEEEQLAEEKRLAEERQIVELRRMAEISRHAEPTHFADKRLAQQKRPIESGCYIINNARYKDMIVYLEDASEGSSVAGEHEGNTYIQSEQKHWWNVSRLPNGRYTIKSFKHGNFANVRSRASPGETVEGGRRMQLWTIQETCLSGLYKIGTSDTTMFWKMLDGEAGSPISLDDVDTNSWAWWTFSPPRERAAAVGNATYAETTCLAKKLLAEQTGPLESGRYVITNVATKNLAFLPDPNHATPLAASYGEANPDEEWKITRLNNGRYSIQNVSYKAFANGGNCASLGDCVEGRRSVQLWTIQETRFRGKYTIGCSNNALFWALLDDEYETPIMLDSEINNQRTWWTFTTLIEEAIAVDDSTHAEITRLAEKRLTVPTGPIESARYIIANVATKNLAFLPGFHDGTPLTGGRGRDMRREQWKVTRLSNGRYSIQNASHKAFANIENYYGLEDRVEGRRSVQLWTIQETQFRGKYAIGCSNNTLFWAAPDNERGSPIMLDSEVNNQRTWWTFTPLIEEAVAVDNSIHADIMRLAQKCLVEQTGHIESGRYVITHVVTKNLAFLPGSQYGAPLTASYGRDMLSEQWQITRLRNGHYLVANVCHQNCFANAQIGASLDNKVVGSSSRQEWTIQETCARGQYTIGCSNNTVFWALINDEDKTLVTLDGAIDNIRTWWTFTPLLEEPIDMENTRHAEIRRLAEEYLSEQPECIKSGRYIITSARCDSDVYLQDPYDGTPLTASYGWDMLSDQWEVTRLNNGRYLIANVHHNNCFANADAALGSVVGSSSMQTWVINETRVRGQYRIGSSETTMLWTLLDCEPDCSVVVRNARADNRAWWIFNEVKGA